MVCSAEGKVLPVECTRLTSLNHVLLLEEEPNCSKCFLLGSHIVGNFNMVAEGISQLRLSKQTPQTGWLTQQTLIFPSSRIKVLQMLFFIPGLQTTNSLGSPHIVKRDKGNPVCLLSLQGR